MDDASNGSRKQLVMYSQYVAISEAPCKLENRRKASSSIAVPVNKYISNIIRGNGSTRTPQKHRSRSEKGVRGTKNGSIKSPPYSVQLEEMIGTIRNLFCNRKADKPPGIAQLQWALNFLKSVQSPSQKTTKEIERCIGDIEDRLIEQYAGLVDEVQGDEANTETCANYIEGNSYVSVSTDVESCSFGDNSEISIINSKIILTPFSVNYEEMMKNAPVKYEEQLRQTKSSENCSATAKGFTAKMKEFRDLKAANAQMLTDKTDKDNMLKFLRTWRNEQVVKVKDELQRLNSIDGCIKNVEKENFFPFLEETKVFAEQNKNSKLKKEINKNKKSGGKCMKLLFSEAKVQEATSTIA